MMQQDNSDDPWRLEALETIPTPDDGPHLMIETLEGVEPLDMQMGVWPPKTVPDVLYEPLFGQPEPTEAEVEAAGGDSEAVPPMQTYAILDAAKVFGLADMLDTSGLEHRCLFKGDAYDELKDVAPWIVRLEEGSDFTRNLFTVGKEPWFMWDKEPGIYVRSRGTLDDMWRHFRKFTRVQDEDGKWYYFRFWEGSFICFILSYTRHEDLLVQLVSLYGHRKQSIPQKAVVYNESNFVILQVNKLTNSALHTVSFKQAILEFGIWKQAHELWREFSRSSSSTKKEVYVKECLDFCRVNAIYQTDSVFYTCKFLLHYGRLEFLKNYSSRLPIQTHIQQKAIAQSLKNKLKKTERRT